MSAQSSGPTDRHREPPRSPPARLRLENAWNPRPAAPARALAQAPLGQPIPVAADERLPAGGAVRGPTRFVVDVAGIDVVEAVLEADVPRPRQRRRRRGRLVQHLEIRMESREVQGN